MSFLSCLPCVFVIEKDYEILINTKECGIAHIEIDGAVEICHILGKDETIRRLRVGVEKLQ